MESGPTGPRRDRAWPVRPRDTHQHVHIEDPAVLPGTDTQRLQVDAALVVEYPVQGVGNLCAKVITASTFKFRGGIG